MRIGVISDTHGRFAQAVKKIFRGVDSIIHAGDIGALEVLEQLEEIAPTIAVNGNNDSFDGFPIRRVEEMMGYTVLVQHIFGELHQLDRSARKVLEELHPNVVVFGHSHRPYSQMSGETLLFNPGSAGPRRFSLPRSVGLLKLDRKGIKPEIIYL